MTTWWKCFDSELTYKISLEILKRDSAGKENVCFAIMKIFMEMTKLKDFEGKINVAKSLKMFKS